MKKTSLLSLLSSQGVVIALALLSAYPTHSALAQTSDASAVKKDTTQLEAVIVTGTRRSENIKEVPQSISTMSGEALETLNASGQDIRALSARVPSLNIESDFGRTFPRFYVRGQGNTDFDLNASQPVGLVVDDVVQENPILKGFPLFDIAQVEVLRGPQGTLFGRNSPAGVLKFDSVAPGKRSEGYFSLGFGRFGAVNVEGAINVPLGPDWALRASALSQSADDRVFNSVPGGQPSLEGYKDRAARVQASYTNGGFNAVQRAWPRLHRHGHHLPRQHQQARHERHRGWLQFQQLPFRRPEQPDAEFDRCQCAPALGSGRHHAALDHRLRQRDVL